MINLVIRDKIVYNTNKMKETDSKSFLKTILPQIRNIYSNFFIKTAYFTRYSRLIHFKKVGHFIFQFEWTRIRSHTIFQSLPWTPFWSFPTIVFTRTLWCFLLSILTVWRPIATLRVWRTFIPLDIWSDSLAYDCTATFTPRLIYEA